MMTVNHDEIKTKALSFKAVMNNPKLSKAIFDAWEAPAGSSKAKRVKSILRSVQISGKNFGLDGQGGIRYSGQGGVWDTMKGLVGVGDSQQSGTSGATTPQQIDPNVQDPMAPKQTKFLKTIDHIIDNPISSAAPSPASKFSTAADTAGALGSMIPESPFSGKSRKSTAGNVLSNIAKGAFELPGKIKEEVSTAGNYLKDYYLWANKISLLTKDKYLGGEGYPTLDQAAEYAVGKTGMYPTYDSPVMDWLKKQTSKLSGGVDPNSDVVLSMDPKTGKIKVDAKPPVETGQVDANGNPIGPLQEDGSFYQNESDNYNILADIGETELDRWFRRLSAEEQAANADVYQAVKNGIGAETWAMQAMQNKDILKKVGFSDEQIKLMPKSGLLSESLITLREATKQEYRLDSQLQRLMDLQSQGMTITEDTQAYIRGKDEYLGAIDKLLYDSKEASMQMPVSNPYVAQRMANYTSYLTIARGRQSQRYIDFIDTSIAYNTARTAEAKSLYDTTFADAKAQYDDDVAITTESFNNTNTILKSLYANIEGRTEQLREEVRWGYEKTQQSADELNTMIKSVAAIDKIKGVTIDYTPMSNFDEKVVGITTDKDGTKIFNTYDPQEIVERANYHEQPVLTATNSFVRAGGTNLYNKASSGSFIGELNKYKDVVTQNIRSSTSKEVADYYSKYWLQVSTPFTSSIRDGIKRYLTDDTSKVKTMKEAMRSLSGKGWFTKAKSKDDRASFIEDYKDELGDLAGIIFDMFFASVEGVNGEGIPPEEVYGMLMDMSDEEFIRTISLASASSIMDLTK